MRRRMILVLSLTLLGMLAILTATTRLILLQSFTDLEHRYVEKDVERALNALRADMDALSSTANDWAAWDETYDFASSRDPGYVEANMTDDVFVNLRLNVLLLVDTGGRKVYGKGYDLEAGQAAAWYADDLLAALPRRPEFLRHDGTADGIVGIVMLPRAPLLLASRPVTDNTGTAPRRGSLLMGRFLGSAEVGRVSARIGLSIGLYSPVDPTAPSDVRDAPGRLAAAGPILVAPLSTSRVAGYAFIPTGEGQPGLVVRVDGPRDIVSQGMRSIVYLVCSLLLIALVFGTVVILYIGRTILDRIIALSRNMLALGARTEPGRRVPVGGKDQIAYLGAAINGMLDAAERSARSSEAFLDAVPDTIFRIDRDGSIIDARSPARLPLVEAADTLVGQGTEEIVQLYPFISPERLEQTVEATARALATGVPQSLEFDVELDGRQRWFEERIVASGENEAIALVRDVTAARRAEQAERQEVLLREIHHRVKNNLQVISSLLALQAGTAVDPQARSLLKESQDRVRSMALIHEKLYQSGAERGVSFAEYARDLAAHLRHSYAGDSHQVELDVDVEDLSLDMDTSVPCGLIINELVSNALKHAFPGGRAGRVRLGLCRGADGIVVLSVSDNGVGLPAGVDVRAPRTLGLRIVNILAAQIKAVLESSAGEGTTITLSFPAP
jgi:PAS domain S-box-containing protein